MAGESGLGLTAGRGEGSKTWLRGLVGARGGWVGASLKTDLLIFSLFIVYPQQGSVSNGVPIAGLSVVGVRSGCVPWGALPPVENLTGDPGIQTSMTAVNCWAVKEIVKAILPGFDSTPSGLGGQRSTNWKTSLSFSSFLFYFICIGGTKRGLVDRCEEGGKARSWMSSVGMAGISTSFVSCQVSSLLVSWVSQSWDKS